jgi:hypothetical protein
VAAAKGYHETAMSGHSLPGLLGNEQGSLPSNSISVCEYSELQR